MHLIIKTPNVQNKERILKVARVKKNQVTNNNRPIRTTPEFSVENGSQRGTDRCSMCCEGLQMEAQTIIASQLSITASGERKNIVSKRNVNNFCSPVQLYRRS